MAGVAHSRLPVAPGDLIATECPKPPTLLPPKVSDGATLKVVAGSVRTKSSSVAVATGVAPPSTVQVIPAGGGSAGGGGGCAPAGGGAAGGEVPGTEGSVGLGLPGAGGTEVPLSSPTGGGGTPTPRMRTPVPAPTATAAATSAAAITPQIAARLIHHDLRA